MLAADLLPAWKDRKLPAIGRRDVNALLDEVMVRGAPIQANRVRALCSTIFNFALGATCAGGKIGQPVSNPQKWIARIRPRAKLIDFRFYDLRRTAASGMTAIGVERLTVSKILNHAEGGVTKVYDRHSYDNEKRVAMIKWDRHLQRLLTGEADEPKVVQLHA